MEWTRLAGDCNGYGDCPRISLTPNGMVVVQGSVVDGVDPPHGEAVVEITPTMLMEAARALAAR